MKSLITHPSGCGALVLLALLAACSPTPGAPEMIQSPAPRPTVMAFPTFPPAYTPTLTGAAAATRTASPTPTATEPPPPGPDAAATLAAAPTLPPFGGAGDAIAYTCEIPGAFNVGVLKLCLMSLDNPQPIVLASPGMVEERSPVWSPDGMRIAFVSSPGGDSSIFVVNADGDGKTRLTYPAGDEGHFYPAWSPDSKRIAFVSFRGDVSESRLGIVNADGSRLIQTDASDGFVDDVPSWSPDGTRMVMSRNGQIYLFDVDDTTQITLIDTLADGTEPAWSPGGGSIAFRGDSGIYTIALSGDGGAPPTRLTEGRGLFSRPTWSPDGKQIAYTAEVDGHEEVYRVSADGSGQTQLTADLAQSAMSSTIRWSPDGARILYVCSLEGLDTNICIVDADGSGRVILTTNPLLDMEPDWRPAAK